MLPALYTVDELATHAGVDPSTIYRAIRRGDLRACLIGARKVLRVTETAWLDFLGEQS